MTWKHSDLLLLNFDLAPILNIVKFLAYTKIHIYKKNRGSLIPMWLNVLYYHTGIEIKLNLHLQRFKIIASKTRSSDEGNYSVESRIKYIVYYFAYNPNKSLTNWSKFHLNK